MAGAKKRPEAAVSETPKNKGGRPRKLTPDEATLKQIEGLGRLQATVREAAAFFKVSPVTFEAFLKQPGVREAFEEGKGQGLLSLRRSQFRLAESNAAMAIFLGKNYLDQADRVEQAVEHSGSLEVSDARERLARIVAGHATARNTDEGAGKPH